MRRVQVGGPRCVKCASNGVLSGIYTFTLAVLLAHGTSPKVVHFCVATKVDRRNQQDEFIVDILQYVSMIG